MNSPDIEKNISDYTALCESIVSKIEPSGAMCRGTRLHGVLSKSLCETRKIFIRAENFSETNSTLSDAFLWLTDNYSFIEEEFAFCLSALPKLSGTACKNSLGHKHEIPFVYAAASELCRICEGEITRGHINSLVKICDMSVPSGIGYDDFSSFPIFLKCALLSYIGGIAEKFSGNNGIFEGDDSGIGLISAIKSLKYQTIHNYAESFEDCRLESILANDPANAYPHMTDASKSELRRLLHREAKHFGISDVDYAKRLYTSALDGTTPAKRYIGYNIGKPSKTNRLYFPLLYISAALITLAAALATNIWFFPLLFFPLLDAIKPVADAVASKFCKNTGLLPSLKTDEIPDSAKTLCVITALLRGEEHDGELFSRLETIYNANSGKNIKFGLLCDLCDSDSATKSTDEAALAYADGRIASLCAKYGNDFILFIRPRSYSKSERTFMAYERKRGAVIELVRLIKSGVSSFDSSRAGFAENLDFIKQTKYVITLDADTNLGLDAARELVGKMLHPKNAPVIDKNSKMVISGYGIMQPKMSTDLNGARATPFSRLICGSGGTDIYSGASFDLYQSLFGQGIFCGKGIFHVEAFYDTIVKSDFFPEDTILSHDILEGERLRTALLCDTELTDGFPKNELSYLKRKHRWIRGDIQNLIFLKRNINVGGKKRKNDLGTLSRYKLFDNARRAVTPIISLSLIIVSFFCPPSYSAIFFFSAFAPCIVPFITDAATLAATLTVKSAARKFFSKGVTVGIWQSFLRMLFFSAMLAKDALLCLSAAVISAYRMLVSKKNLLEWVTAAQSDSGKPTAMLFISKHILSALLGAFLFFFAPGGLIKLAGLAFFTMPLIAFLTSKDFGRKKSVSETDRKKLSAYAADIWKFFEENVGASEHFLPPDNIQLSPYEKIAHRTSPTNIGLYLASAVTARDFGIIDTAELYKRLNDSVSTIERLPKWSGHLYNWYDTENLSVLEPKYISSVDSGNFIACLIAVRNGLSEYTHEEPKLVETINRISRIITETDFSVLYNKSRGLFTVGAVITNGKAVPDTGCYDFLMSEARILSYLSVASRTVPKSHWKKLSRPLVTSGGYIGLSSWSGTAFEYFMPDLFMPIQKGSLLYEAMLFAYRAQSSRRAGEVWGISESGFFAFDCDLNYQYKAFGIPLLGQKNGLENDLVISPYSTFLALCVSVSGALENLEALSRLKIYGKYGFYEAIDFTRSRVKDNGACVKSYMSHHLGMSMLALANAYFDGIVTKRFMQDRKMECGRELLEEKIPVNAVIKKLKKGSTPHVHFEKSRPPEKVSLSPGSYSFAAPVPACISDGKMSCIISDCGGIRIVKGNTLLCASSDKKYFADCPASLYCYLKLDGKIYGMTPLACKPEADASFSFSYSECSVGHSLECGAGSFMLSYTIASDCRSLLRIKLSGASKAKKSEFCFAFFPCLSPKAAYESHPAFSELFVEAIYDEEEKIVFYKRRRRSPSDEDFVLAAALADKNCDPHFSTRRQSGMPQSFIYDPFRMFKSTDESEFGACVNPFCGINAEYGASGAELLLVMTHNTESAKEAIISARKSSFETAEHTLSEIVSQFALSSGISSVGNDGAVRGLLSDIIYGSMDLSNKKRACLAADKIFSENSPQIGINSLWKFGISGDDPVIVIDMGGYFFPSPPEKRLRAFKLLTMKNIRCDLVILYQESDKYERKLEKRLRELLAKCSVDGYLGRRRGGIHLIEKSALGEDITAFKYFASAYTDIFSDTARKKEASPDFKADSIPVISGKSLKAPQNGYKVQGGFFADKGFTVDKSQNIPLPWAHVLSGENISCVLSQNSLGYTFYKNASERRITPWTESGNGEMKGERIYLSENGVLFDLAACASYVKYSCGKAEYFGKAASYEYHITVFCCAKLPAKAIKAELSAKNYLNSKSLGGNSKLCFFAEPCMGKFLSKNAIKPLSESTVAFKNPLSESFSDYRGFVSVFSDSQCFNICSKAAFFSAFQPGRAPILDFGERDLACVGTEIGSDSEKFSCCFVIGAEKTGSLIAEKISEAFSEGTDRELRKAELFSSSLIPKMSFSPAHNDDTSQSLCEMFNLFLPYSTVFSRILARSGFYQSGGAYGFRDQLQDSLCLICSDIPRALTMLYRAASHQFPEGDALHWWHIQGSRGIRTRCSDDYLWLAYVTAEFERILGNNNFLEVKLPYICGESLPDKVSEKYMTFSLSPVRESLYLHCLRALDRGCSLLGEHGLCLMGSCDWCDGYSVVGKDGKGESVWTSMFLINILENFIPICRKHGDGEKADFYLQCADKLKKAVLLHGYDENAGYFIRGYYDNGAKLGAPEADGGEGKIDLLPQSFAPLCGMPQKAAATALLKAHEQLFDSKIGIMKLLSSPFDKSTQEPGYIKGYLAGVRENGGQYTHGALFYALGCFLCSDMLYQSSCSPDICLRLSQIGEDILKYSNPAFRSSESAPEAVRRSYLTEPYAIAADIYSNKDHAGRGGWTHYTGAAGWLYRLVLEYVFGIRFSKTDTEDAHISVNTQRIFPFAKITGGSTLRILEFGFDITVKYVADGKKCVTVDGKILPDGRIGKDIKSAEIHI